MRNIRKENNAKNGKKKKNEKQKKLEICTEDSSIYIYI